MNKIYLLQEILTLLKQIVSKREQEEKSYEWHENARPNQLPPPGKWRTWLILAGRGFGKTQAGAETIRKWVQDGLCRRVALIGETHKDVRQVMVEGVSGLLAVHPPSEKPLYEPSKYQLTWKNGAIAKCFSSISYDQLRGPQFDAAWIDELAKFPDGEKVWDQLMFSLRLGQHPRAIVTTTPRPLKLLKNLMNSPDVAITKGTTFENAKNLARPFLDYVQQQYEKSWLGRQELYADIIDSHEGALWSPALLERSRESYRDLPLKRIIIAIDPAVSHGDQSDETGIIVAGLTEQNIGVILEDLSLKAPVSVWMERVLEAYHRLHADRVVAEINMGGNLVEQLLRSYDPSISYKGVRATRGKILRAEPIAALYEQDKVWHAHHFYDLEEQLCSYIPGVTSKSPDRLDALVWALTDLMLNPTSQLKLKVWSP